MARTARTTVVRAVAITSNGSCRVAGAEVSDVLAEACCVVDGGVDVAAGHRVADAMERVAAMAVGLHRLRPAELVGALHGVNAATGPIGSRKTC